MKIDRNLKCDNCNNKNQKKFRQYDSLETKADACGCYKAIKCLVCDLLSDAEDFYA